MNDSSVWIQVRKLFSPYSPYAVGMYAWNPHRKLLHGVLPTTLPECLVASPAQTDGKIVPPRLVNECTDSSSYYDDEIWMDPESVVVQDESDDDGSSSHSYLPRCMIFLLYSPADACQMRRRLDR